MALFIKQNEQRSQLQSKIAADLANRVKVHEHAGRGDAGEPSILNDSKEATGRSLFWVSVVTMIVVALVVFVLFIFEGI